MPVTLHLDHCPYRDVISECLRAGWISVLFDAHELDVTENLEKTKEVVAEARANGAHVEGEIEGSRTASGRTRRRPCASSRLPSTSSGPPGSTSSPLPSVTRPGGTCAVVATTREHIALFGGSGRVW
ncbi:class II fructose-bisphosphate aldolase [Nakamurella sp.]|uniref:class II fructose-bisphosphate aldolase n=1 Tax=Nakamurella sp. TaxID=1869182 RepID=UPI00378458DF